jgi:hypothetical protein
VGRVVAGAVVAGAEVVVPAVVEVVRREATGEAAGVLRGVKEDLHGLEAISLSSPSSPNSLLNRRRRLGSLSRRSSLLLRLASGRDIVLV